MADHIKIHSAPGMWVVRAGGAVLGETSRALELAEGDYTPVIYFPREDLAMAFFEKTEKSSHCPWKGAATYYTIHAKSGPIENSAWSYETPNDSVGEIANYIAFYTDRVTVEKL